MSDSFRSDQLRALLILTLSLLPIRSPAQDRVSLVDDHVTQAATLGTLGTDTLASPGIPVGITSYDRQHYDAQGRQIACNPGGDVVHFVWTMWDIIPTSAEQYWRFVGYNGFDKGSASRIGGSDGTAISLGDFALGGFCRLDVDERNLAQVTLHQRSMPEVGFSVWHIELPLDGSSLHLDTELPAPQLHSNEDMTLWSDIAVTQSYSSDAIYHVISTSWLDIGGGLGAPSDRLWYYRFDLSAPPPTWEGPVLIDSTKSLSYTIDAADNTGKVAIAFTSNYATDNLNGVNNVVYRESHTNGAGWLNGSELGESNKLFITSYSDTLGRSAWTETSIAYDHNADLHILFTESRFPGSEQRAIKHWSDARGTVRTVTEAYYPNANTWYRLANIGQISISVGDGATSCYGGAETNENYLYILYTKLGGTTAEERGDTSAAGLSNGELYLTRSPNGGQSWSVPVNLTNTKTPNCNAAHSDSVCASEAWATMARDVHDIEILYIRDFDAGAFDETSWTLNHVMYLSLPGGGVDADFLCQNSPCGCVCHAEPECDGLTNVLDVVTAVNVAFKGVDATTDPLCAFERTDVNCDGASSVLDVVLIINVAFKDAAPEDSFCNPCL